MAEAPQTPEPKISLVEAIGIGLVCIVADLISLIPGGGDVMDIVVGGPLQLYLFMKGVNGVFVFAGTIIEAIPALQALPARIVTWGITIYVDRNPALEKVAEKIGEVETLGEGAAGGAAAAEGEGAAIAAEAAEAEQAAQATAQAAETEGSAAAAEAEGGSSRGGRTEAEIEEDDKRRKESGRPSEESTERGSRRTEEEIEADRGMSGEDLEDAADEIGGAKDKNKDQDYEDLMQSGNEPESMEALEEQFFSEKGPTKQKQGTQEDEEAENSNAKHKKLISPENDALAKQFERIQKINQQREQGVEVKGKDEDSNYIDEAA